MYQQRNNAESDQHSRRHAPRPRPARSYRQIAQILAEREGVSITPSVVKAICRAAERKLAQALGYDPVLN